MKVVRDIWNAARPIDPVSLPRYVAALLHPPLINPAAAHLSRLGRLDLTASTALRFMPHAPHPSGRAEPAIVAAITKGWALIGVEFTFLKPDGTALTDKHVVGEHDGGVIRLADPGDDDDDYGPAELLIAPSWQHAAELEKRYNSAAAWGSITAANLPKITLPLAVRRVAILGDYQGGFALQAASRWQSRATSVRLVRDDRPDPAELWTRAGMPENLKQELS